MGIRTVHVGTIMHAKAGRVSGDEMATATSEDNPYQASGLETTAYCLA